MPIGCVIVCEDKIIGRGYNRRTTDKNPLAHAEMIAIKKRAKKLVTGGLKDCRMYVTLEPCQMCSGAIVQFSNEKGSCRLHECEGGVCRFDTNSSANGRI